MFRKITVKHKLRTIPHKIIQKAYIGYFWLGKIIYKVYIIASYIGNFFNIEISKINNGIYNIDVTKTNMGEYNVEVGGFYG